MPDLSVRPVKLAQHGADGVLVEWSDGEQRVYTFRELRDNCPCANCREKRMAEPPKKSPLQLNVLSAAEARPLKLAEMNPVGQYAYSLHFSDGHDTGIYTFELLRRLGQRLEPRS